MDKVKIREIADELGLKSKEVVEKCAEIGIDAKSHASAITLDEAERVTAYVLHGIKVGPDGKEIVSQVSEEPKKEVVEERTDRQEIAQPKAPIAQEKPIEKEPQINITPEETAAPAEVAIQPTVAIKERRGLVIVKKAKTAAREQEAQRQQQAQQRSVFAELEEQRAALLRQKKAKKAASSTIPTKKNESVKLNLLGDRDISESGRFESYDDVVVLPDLSMQSVRLAEDEPAVPKDANKAKTAAKRPAQRQNIASLARPQKKRRKVYDKPTETAEIHEIEIPEDIRVYEFAEKIGKSIGEVIKVLFGLGSMVTKNDFLDKDSIEILAEEFDVKVTTKNVLDDFDYLTEYENEEVEDYEEIRPPIVTIMGHVDHGKTTLLDKIRNAKVAHGEAGGITQHIGAYSVVENDRLITFLDTPGHEAFTHMRARGAQLTDIAIIVVAADDGVMPQTKEAIAHVQDANVPFIVAVNKMDKPSANPDFVKTQLSEMGVTPLEWGGQHEFVPISAKMGQGLDTLLDTILLQADILEIKANPKKRAKAVVVEGSLEKGRGPVATVLIKDGTLRVGDNVVVGSNYGKVRAIIDDLGQQVKLLGPSQPGQILGLDGVPRSGDILVVVENEKAAKEYAQNIKEHFRQRELSKSTKATFDDLHNLIVEGKLKRLNVILKADVQGSLEAIKANLETIRNDEVKVSVIHSAVGAITESDVELASAGEGTLILGFNQRPNNIVKDKADAMGVEIRSYSVIFELIDDIKVLLGQMLSPVYKESALGKAEVRNKFTVGKTTVIAGCLVIDGSITKDAKARVLRGSKVIYEGKIGSLKRFKDDVREVKNGYECGIVLHDFNDIEENDIIECYKMIAEAGSFESTGS